MSKTWELWMAETLYYGQDAEQDNYLVRDVFRPIAHQIKNEDARRIVASWNALADADLEDLEQDGLLADPKVAALVEAARQVIWKLSHNHDTDEYKGPARIDRRDATVRMLADALQALEGEEERDGN